MDELLSVNFKNHFKAYERDVYRTVEGQHFISTRKLVDSDREHEILEGILDKSKPAAPTRNSRGPLHYLLFTPFRYPPLKSGGRFHTRIEQSIFYGSEELKTSMAEVAYGRFLFMQHTEADLMPMHVSYTHFVARIKSRKALLLTAPPFTDHRSTISHPSSYTTSQTLGAAMRGAETELFTFHSARNPTGVNVGLFSVEAFQHNKPIHGKDGHWIVYISQDTVEFKRSKESHVFTFADFCINGQFAAVNI